RPGAGTWAHPRELEGPPSAPVERVALEQGGCMALNVDGMVEPGFEGVRDAFVRNFEEHGEVGAGYSLHVEGHKVVDIWGGVADQSTGRPYDHDTLQLVFSTTKGATASCLNLLIQRGLI